MHDLIQLIHELLRSPLVIGGFQISALVLVRILPMVVFTPVFGGQAVPARFRFGLAVVVALGFVPGFFPVVPLAASTGVYMLLVAKEAVVGLTLAMYILVLFQSIAAAGSLVGLSGGTTSSVVHDPYVGGQQSVIGNFKMQLAIVLFLTLGGHRILFGALGDSFVTIQPGEVMPARFVDGAMSTTMIALVSNLFVVAVQIAAPVIIVIFLLDVCLGLINRVAPQIQVFFLGLTVKSTVATLVLFLILGLVFDILRTEFVRSLQALLRLVHG